MAEAKIPTVEPSQVEGIPQLVRHFGSLYPMWQKYKPEYKLKSRFVIINAIAAGKAEAFDGTLIDLIDVREFDEKAQIVLNTMKAVKVGEHFKYYESIYKVTKVIATRDAGPEISIVDIKEVKVGQRFLHQTLVLEITEVFDSRLARGEHKVKAMFYDCGFKVAAEVKKPEPPKEQAAPIKQGNPV